MSDKDEEALDRLEDVLDALEEIVTEAGRRDGENYLQDLKVRSKKVQGRCYLSLMWYRSAPPAPSVLYAPFGCWLCRWYRTIDKNGTKVWQSAIEMLRFYEE